MTKNGCKPQIHSVMKCLGNKNLQYKKVYLISFNKSSQKRNDRIAVLTKHRYIAVHLNLLKKNCLCKGDSALNDKGKKAVSTAPLTLLI